VYLDVRATVGATFFSGRGLGSGFGFVAFHPGFATNGRFYTVHSEAFGALASTTPDWTQPDAVIHSVLTEWTATNPAAATYSGTRDTLLRIGAATYIHAIQQIGFNPNATPASGDYGLLYVAVGDGGLGARTTGPQQRDVPTARSCGSTPRARTAPTAGTEVGGFVYRGNALPALRGKYVFGDIVDGRVFYTDETEMVRGRGLAPLYQLRILTAAGVQTSLAALAGDSRVDLRLGVDRAGELYVLSKANGRIWKVTGAARPATRTAVIAPFANHR
jgi:hypothetical protein